MGRHDVTLRENGLTGKICIISSFGSNKPAKAIKPNGAGERQRRQRPMKQRGWLVSRSRGSAQRNNNQNAAAVTMLPTMHAGGEDSGWCSLFLSCIQVSVGVFTPGPESKWTKRFWWWRRKKERETSSRGCYCAFRFKFQQ